MDLLTARIPSSVTLRQPARWKDVSAVQLLAAGVWLSPLAPRSTIKVVLASWRPRETARERGMGALDEALKAASKHVARIDPSRWWRTVSLPGTRTHISLAQNCRGCLWVRCLGPLSLLHSQQPWRRTTLPNTKGCSR
jgi:hypothetical protein